MTSIFINSGAHKKFCLIFCYQRLFETRYPVWSNLHDNVKLCAYPLLYTVGCIADHIFVSVRPHRKSFQMKCYKYVPSFGHEKATVSFWKGRKFAALANFHICRRLYFLQGALNQCEWRASQLWNRLLEHCISTMDVSYHNLRERIGSTLCTITWFDIPHSYIDPRVPSKLHPPKVADVMHTISSKVTVCFFVSWSD